MTALTYLGGIVALVWALGMVALFVAWVRATAELERDIKRCERAFSESVPTDTRPSTGPLMERLADEGAEILKRERQRGT